MLVDYTFYEMTYMGNVAAETFEVMLPKAEAVFNALTLGHIVESDGVYGQMIRGTFTEFTEKELTACKMGMCSMIDTMAELAGMKAQALAGAGDTGNIRSVSSGGESITYDAKVTAYTEALVSRTAEMRLYGDALKLYMRPEIFTVNPFFAGVM